MATIDLPGSLAPNEHVLSVIHSTQKYRAQSGVIQAENRPADRFGLRLMWPPLGDTRRRALLAILAALGRADGATGRSNWLRIDMVNRLGLRQGTADVGAVTVAVTANGGARRIRVSAAIGVGDFVQVGDQLCVVEAAAGGGAPTVDVWPPLYSVNVQGTAVDYRSPAGTFELIGPQPSELAAKLAAVGTLADVRLTLEQAIF